MESNKTGQRFSALFFFAGYEVKTEQLENASQKILLDAKD